MQTRFPGASLPYAATPARSGASATRAHVTRLTMSLARFLRRPHTLAAALLVLAFATAADARTRSFCGGAVKVSCGGHLQPGCSSGPACDPGFKTYCDAPFPKTIDCPWPVKDAKISCGCYEDIPSCDDCGGLGQPACPPEAAAYCPVGCDAGLSEVLGRCFACGGTWQPECSPDGLEDSWPGPPIPVPDSVLCKDGNRRIGKDSAGHALCGLCGSGAQDALLACPGAPPCHFGYHVRPSLGDTLTSCPGVTSPEHRHFLRQNGICSPAGPEDLARLPHDPWPPDEGVSGDRSTAFVIHGRGADCTGSMDRLLDAGRLFEHDLRTYCVEYFQEDDGSGGRLVRILPTAEDVTGGLPPCFLDGSCRFESERPAFEGLAAAAGIRAVGDALADAIRQVPTEGEISLIAHSGGGFVARELIHRHYDALRASGKKISRVITLGHAYYGTILDPSAYAPFYCSRQSGADCERSLWLWGWQEWLDTGSGRIDDTDLPQIDWVAASGTGTDADGKIIRHPSPEEGYSDACLAAFGGVQRTSVAGDGTVPIESSLGRDQFGFFPPAPELALDLRLETPCTHNGACMLRELLAADPARLPELPRLSPSTARLFTRTLPAGAFEALPTGQAFEFRDHPGVEGARVVRFLIKRLREDEYSASLTVRRLDQAASQPRGLVIGGSRWAASMTCSADNTGRTFACRADEQP